MPVLAAARAWHSGHPLSVTCLTTRRADCQYNSGEFRDPQSLGLGDAPYGWRPAEPNTPFAPGPTDIPQPSENEAPEARLPGGDLVAAPVEVWTAGDDAVDVGAIRLGVRGARD